MLAVGSKPDVASVLAIYKKNSDFQPKTHLYAKLFLQKTNLEQVSARVGKSAEPGLSASLKQLAFQERRQ